MLLRASQAPVLISPHLQIFVFNLDKSVTSADLQPLFKPFRSLQYATVALGKKGTSRRFGFALFGSRTDADAAMATVHGMVLKGKPIAVKPAVAGEPERRYGGPYGCEQRPPLAPAPQQVAAPACACELPAITSVWTLPGQEASAPQAAARLAAPVPRPALVPHQPPAESLASALPQEQTAARTTFRTMRPLWAGPPPSMFWHHQQYYGPPPGYGAPPGAAPFGSAPPDDCGRDGRPPRPMALMQMLQVTSAALEGRSFIPAWARQGSDRLVMAEALDTAVFSPTLHSRTPHAAVSAPNLSLVFLTRNQVTPLARVEALLKRAASLGPGPPPSVLKGAVVRVLVDRAYRLRIVQETVVEGGEVALVLNEMESPVAIAHVSNTNCLRPPLSPAAEEEVLELAAQLAYRGTRLRKEDLAAACWAGIAAAQWHAQHASKVGEELIAALAGLRAALADSAEYSWRQQALQELHVEEEEVVVQASLRLPWSEAASWMMPAGGGLPAAATATGEGGMSTPARPLLAAWGGAGLGRAAPPTPDSGSSGRGTDPLEQRPFGPYTVPSSAPAPTPHQLRSLHRGAADPARHQAWMQSALRQLSAICERSRAQASAAKGSPGTTSDAEVEDAAGELLREACWPTCGGAVDSSLAGGLAQALAASLALCSPPRKADASADGKRTVVEEEGEAFTIPAFRG
eukprot:scaffold5.g695.t1